jgi:hypothetical protein
MFLRISLVGNISREGAFESIGLQAKARRSISILESMQSADYASEVSEEAAFRMGMQDDMPLQDIMPYDPQSAEEDLAQRATAETGSGGDPHLHNERKAEEIAKQMTEDTGAEGDMTLHAERKVNRMGSEMFQD